MTSDTGKFRLGASCAAIAVAATMALSHGAMAQQDGLPTIMIGGETDFDACGAVGEITGLDPQGDNFLAVRFGPGSEHQQIDSLHNGDLVYMCGTEGDWEAVIYGDDLSACGLGSPVMPRQPYTGPCNTGWIFTEYLILIAG